MRPVRVLAALLLFALPAAADEVELVTGEVIRDCKIVAEGENYRIHKGPGSRLVNKVEVRKITYSDTPDDLYVKKAKELKDDDVAGHLKLAKWCRDMNLPARVTEEYGKVLAADPDHEEARAALGYQRHQGRWLTQDEINEAQGLVRHKGRWMTPEERDLDVVLEQLKETEKKYLSEVKKWIDQVASSSEEKRKEARESLAKLEDKYKVKYLVTGLRSSSPHLRLFSAEELRRIKDELLKTGDAGVLSAVKSLARMVIWDDSLDVRSASMKALGAIDHPKTADAFLPFLGEESTAARIRTEDCLSQFKSLRSVPPLIQLLERTTSTLAFIEQYEKQIAQIIKDSIVLKSGQKVMVPANVKISPTLFDPQSKRMLAEERDAVAAALRAISGQTFGADIPKWKAWYESAKK